MRSLAVVGRHIYPILAPVLYLLLAASSAALLAYPIHQFTGGSVPLEQIVKRSAQVLLLAGLYPILRQLGLNASKLGFASSKRVVFLQISRGLLYGAAVIGVLIAAFLLLGIRVLNPEDIEKLATSWPSMLLLLAKALFGGLAVALGEEFVFRGVLIAILIRHASVPGAVCISALYYSALHFLHSDIQIDAADLHWYSGLLLVLDALRHAFSMQFIDVFLALFAAGVFLGCIRVCVKNSLGYCIGLHAGWIFSIKILKSVSLFNIYSAWPGLVSPYDGVTGYLAAVWLGGMIVLFLIAKRQRSINDRTT